MTLSRLRGTVRGVSTNPLTLPDRIVQQLAKSGLNLYGKVRRSIPPRTLPDKSVQHGGHT